MSFQPWGLHRLHRRISERSRRTNAHEARQGSRPASLVSTEGLDHLELIFAERPPFVAAVGPSRLHPSARFPGSGSAQTFES